MDAPKIKSMKYWIKQVGGRPSRSWKAFFCKTCYFFVRGPQKKYIASAIYRICDISHLRYSKAEKNKTEAASSFSQHRDSETTHERKNGGAKNRRCDLGFTFSRSRLSSRCSRVGFLQWQVFMLVQSFSFKLPFFNFFHNFFVFIIILNKFKKIIECEQSNNDSK